MAKSTLAEWSSRLQPLPLVPLPDRTFASARVPIPLGPLVGREREIEQGRRLLLQEDVRLVTLTGPGGVGKTRLALELARALATHFCDGAAFVSLAPVTQPALLGPVIAQALDVRASGRSPLAHRLADALRDRHFLLVLDNLEHLVEGAPLIVDLLAACSRLRVLVTSRVSLRISGEHVFPVPPLSLPDLALPSQRPAEAEAVRLFAARAQAADPTFALCADNVQTVAAICNRLDGLPLAIELAAAKVRLLPPAALLPRLDRVLPLLTGGRRDDPSRHRTMRAAIAWSYGLLTAEEQRLFRRLAVFAGGFTLDAAEHVASSPSVPATSVLLGIEALVDHSLVERFGGDDGKPRFRMLGTIREFALGQLEASDESNETKRRFAEWCTAVAEEANQHMESPELDTWWPRLVAEHDNFRAALDWLETGEDPATMLRLAAALWRFWYHDSYLDEGCHWLGCALTIGGTVSARLRLEVLIGAALLSHFHDKDDVAAAHCMEALALSRDLNDRLALARVRYVQGLVQEDAGRYEAAEALFGEALENFEAVGNVYWAGLTRTHRGTVALGRGELRSARALLERSLADHREHGYGWAVSHALLYLAHVALADRDVVAASAALAEAMALETDLGTPRSIALDTIATIGALAVLVGQPMTAAKLLGWVAARQESVGASSRFPERDLYEWADAEARKTLGEPIFSEAWMAGRALGIDGVFAEARSLVSERAAEAPASAEPRKLTPREVEILHLLAGGGGDKEIAVALGISRHTVSHHVTSILTKLGLESRAAAAVYAVRHGLA